MLYSEGLTLDQKIHLIPISSIHPSPENNKIYIPPDKKDPSIRRLALDIKKNGLLEPLCISLDGYIVSGHRRFLACQMVGLKELRVQYVNIYSDDPRFVKLLTAFNKQRVKSIDEAFHEAIVEISDEDAYERLLLERRKSARIGAKTMRITGAKKRAAISKAKIPFLRAVSKILADNRAHWPLSDRQIHYRLLNDPPLIHAHKKESRYRNNPASYKALTDLLTRARLEGRIPFDSIADLTRPFRENRYFKNAKEFLEKETGSFMKYYRRNLLQSQSNHIEIFAEKLTLQNIIYPIAADFCIPVTITRGYSSLPPRKELFERFKASGKEHLVLLALADYDPDGEEIVQSLARSMRDDFGLQEDQLKTVKVALNREQVTELRLPPMMKAKKTSSRYKKFRKSHGDNVWELEAVPAQKLKEILQKGIEEVINVDLFNKEIAQERRDAKILHMKRAALLKTIASMNGAIGA